MTTDSYRVLALDGGGVRGLIPAQVLAEIETHMGRPISAMFDLVAGTSTSGFSRWG
jgi:patatin-like phospholipase/acyl hydrolase